MSRKNGHARPFGFFSRFFTDEELRLHQQLERLRKVPEDLREIRLAVERGELCPEDLVFDPDEPDTVDPEHPDTETP
jgi:hypothetical protein